MENKETIKLIVQKKNKKCNKPYCRKEATQVMLLDAAAYSGDYSFALGDWSKDFSVVSTKLIKILSCDRHFYHFDSYCLNECKWYTKEHDGK